MGRMKRGGEGVIDAFKYKKCKKKDRQVQSCSLISNRENQGGKGIYVGGEFYAATMGAYTGKVR